MVWTTGKVLPSFLVSLDGKHKDSKHLFLRVAWSRKELLRNAFPLCQKSEHSLVQARWRAALPIWFPLIPGHISHPQQVLGAGSSPLGGPRQGLFKPNPADRLQGFVRPSWLPSPLSSPGDRIPGQIRNQRRQTQRPWPPFH